jgi:hypothetical protein
MTIDAIIGKFLDDETLVDGGRIAVRDVVEELSGEGVTVHAMTVANVQMIIRHALPYSAREWRGITRALRVELSSTV